ncbi:hypothetical protein BD626DRAFT_568064 [Schizophyllum amplum]|uniref:Uncharacterized protein n=1 Tax=Schizophyllum amplum TaxID=97359 RepID=A0A550CHL3_9AGAR|nr:hypothetical protein BD626DRAFT_568064 [Auriculariopsis ampla]
MGRPFQTTLGAICTSIQRLQALSRGVKFNKGPAVPLQATADGPNTCPGDTEPEGTTITSLPVELIELIVGFLDVLANPPKAKEIEPEERSWDSLAYGIKRSVVNNAPKEPPALKSCALACRALAGPARRVLWADCKLASNTLEDFVAKFPPSTRSLHSFVRSLEYCGGPYQHQRGRRLFPYHKPGLAYEPENKAFARHLGMFTNLTTLLLVSVRFDELPAGAASAMGVGFPHLGTLVLGFHVIFDSALQLAILLRDLPELHTLQVANSVTFSGTKLPEGLALPKSLRRLALSTEVPAQMQAALSWCTPGALPLLEHCSLTDLTEETLGLLSLDDLARDAGESLKSLTLSFRSAKWIETASTTTTSSGGTVSTSADVEALVDAVDLSEFTSLLELSLEFDRSEWLGLARVLENMRAPNLRYLRIKLPTYVSDSHLDSFDWPAMDALLSGPQFPGLKKVRLAGALDQALGRLYDRRLPRCKARGLREVSRNGCAFEI